MPTALAVSAVASAAGTAILTCPDWSSDFTSKTVFQVVPPSLESSTVPLEVENFLKYESNSSTAFDFPARLKVGLTR